MTDVTVAPVTDPTALDTMPDARRTAPGVEASAGRDRRKQPAPLAAVRRAAPSRLRTCAGSHAGRQRTRLLRRSRPGETSRPTKSKKKDKKKSKKTDDQARTDDAKPTKPRTAAR